MIAVSRGLFAPPRRARACDPDAALSAPEDYGAASCDVTPGRCPMKLSGATGGTASRSLARPSPPINCVSAAGRRRGAQGPVISWPNASPSRGVRLARRNPDDQEIAQIGEEIAAARARPTSLTSCSATRRGRSRASRTSTRTCRCRRCPRPGGPLDLKGGRQDVRAGDAGPASRQRQPRMRSGPRRRPAPPPCRNHRRLPSQQAALEHSHTRWLGTPRMSFFTRSIVFATRRRPACPGPNGQAEHLTD